jgi:hypothetical protein
MNAGPGPAPAAPQPTVAVAAAPSPAVPEAKDAATPAPENPLKLFTPYGELGFRWQGLFYKNPVTGPTPSSFNNNLYNRGEALVRLGLSGQITSRLSYTLRLSSGESRLAGEPWISSASPGARRFVGFDAYNLTFSAPTAKVSPNLTDLVIVGKVNNVPAATGLTEMLIDKDFGVELAANLAIYKFNANTSGSLLTSIGFVTNQGSVGQRFLSPVVSGQVGSPGGLLFGITSDINQYGSPRANAYLIEAAVDHTISSATKLRGSFAFVNISHPSDVPLFIGLTGLLGLNGLNEPNMPQGIQTNLPACLPRNPDGVVPISSTRSRVRLCLGIPAL